MLERAANVQMIYVPFPGNAPTVNAVLGGHVTAGIANYADVVGHLKAGTLAPSPRLRRIASSHCRKCRRPPSPTTRNSSTRSGSGCLRRREPERNGRQLSGWFAAAMQVPEVREKLAVQGALSRRDVRGAEFAAALARQFDDYGRIIREANIS
jgi:tripartite-type tricarboxylate transporter receptor subunit TctC